MRAPAFRPKQTGVHRQKMCARQRVSKLNSVNNSGAPCQHHGRLAQWFGSRSRMHGSTSARLRLSQQLLRQNPQAKYSKQRQFQRTQLAFGHSGVSASTSDFGKMIAIPGSLALVRAVRSNSVLSEFRVAFAFGTRQSACTYRDCPAFRAVQKGRKHSHGCAKSLKCARECEPWF